MLNSIWSRTRSGLRTVSTDHINWVGVGLLVLFGFVLCSLQARYQRTIQNIVTGRNGASLLVLVLCIVVLAFLLIHRGSRAITITALVIGIIVGALLSYKLIVFSVALLGLLFWPLVCLAVLVALVYMALKR